MPNFACQGKNGIWVDAQIDAGCLLDFGVRKNGLHGCLVRMSRIGMGLGGRHIGSNLIERRTGRRHTGIAQSMGWHADGGVS